IGIFTISLPADVLHRAGLVVVKSRQSNAVRCGASPHLDHVVVVLVQLSGASRCCTGGEDGATKNKCTGGRERLLDKSFHDGLPRLSAAPPRGRARSL